jgi:UDP:flavonoid glycosyltransferase YjiC (YdhE family)
MPELMGASDVLVTKAGPGTLSEAFIAGLPVIISDFIPGQEEGNVHYVLEHLAGAYAPDPAKIVSRLRKWLHPDDNTLSQMAANAAALARPEAALIVAQRLHHLLIEKPASHPTSPMSDSLCHPARTWSNDQASRSNSWRGLRRSTWPQFSGRS